MTRLSSFLVAVLALASTACITFEEQSISYLHDAARDRLLVYSVYAGIQGDDRVQAQGRLTTQERGELLNVFSGRRFFLFDNGVRVIDVDELKRQLAEPIPPIRAEVDRVADRAKRAFWAQLTANVSITNGPFYLDTRGRLCAVQRVIVTNLTNTVRAFNESWRRYAATLFEDYPDWAYRAAMIDSPMAFNGNELTMRYPGPPSELEASLSGMVRLASDADGMVVLTIGKPGAARVTVSGRLAAGYTPNAVEFVRQHFGIATSFDPSMDADRFFAAAIR